MTPSSGADDGAGHALARLAAAHRARLDPIERTDGSGPVVGYVGSDVPLEVLDAAGIRAVRLAGDPDAPTTLADQVAEVAIDPTARRLLQRLLDGTDAGLDAVLVGHDTEASARLFHYVRECRHLGIGQAPPVRFVDVIHADGASSRRYVADVVADLVTWAGELAGRAVTDDDLAAALDRADLRRGALAGSRGLRRTTDATLSGTDALAAIGAAATLDPLAHASLLDDLVAASADRPTLSGRRIALTGSGFDHPRLHAALEAAGLVVVAEDHDWGDGWFGLVPDAALDDGRSPLERIAERAVGGVPRHGRFSVTARAAHLGDLLSSAQVDAVVAVLRRGDEGPPWDVPAQRAVAHAAGVELHAVTITGDDPAEIDRAVEAVVAALDRRDGSPAAAPNADLGPGDAATETETDPAPPPPPPPAAPPARAPRPERPRAIAASGIATAHQREWFAGLRAQVESGTPLAVVNADAPHEVLRAMGVPYVVNQWWASICAAKQQGDRYLELLARLGYPDDVEPYSAIALGSALDPDTTDAPWGGLPPVGLLVGETTTDATAKIFEVWARETDARLHLLDATVAPLEPRRWFDAVHDDWESVFGTRRLDLMVEQIDALVASLEDLTGRRFDEDHFAEVMALANEQAEWNARTRDLIATAERAPVAVNEVIPATMIPQWHRGSEWGRDAARRLHDEVAARVDGGEGVVDDERARLMWIGRGLWFDMGFYERIQARHGAVFVWSMYLAVAADAYLRRGGDPRRALAARFCGFADLYNTPPWSSEWYAKEALHNRVDGVVHLTTDAVRGTHFITRAIEAAGVPVLEITGSNVDARAWDAEQVETAVDAFVATRAIPHADTRRASERRV